MTKGLATEARPKLEWSLTPEGTWRHISEELAELLGFDLEELSGDLFFDYLHPGDLEAVLAAHRLWLEGSEHGISHRLRRRDGLYVELETATRIVRDESRDLVAEIACTARATGGEFRRLRTNGSGSSRLARVREVIEGEQITPVYQPIVELASRRVIAYEALSRFPGDPAHTPDRWFEEAWALGMGVELELLAVRVIARALPRIPEDLGVSINASPRTLAASGFMACLGSQANRVTIELTEHLEIEDYRDLRKALSPLTAAGGSTAIDDFGAGYASLAHIVKLDPDWIKLDISLTDEITENPVAHALTRALVSFAEGMGIGVIAEGIETEHELEALTELGVNFGQGFHLGMPAPLEEALAAAPHATA